MRHFLLSPGPLFPVPPHPDFIGLPSLLACVVVGLLAGGLSALLTQGVYFAEDTFEKLPIHWMWWPAIGGLFVGIGGLIEPRVLGVGYETIQGILRGEIIGAALIGILIGKSLVWSIALGSGTSGGVLAPLLMMGAALGAVEARVIPIGDAGVWALISMAAMMGGTMRSPLTAMIFTVELTQDWNLLPGLLVGCIAAHGVTVLLLRRSILTEKVARRGYHVMREYVVNPLSRVRVEDGGEVGLLAAGVAQLLALTLELCLRHQVAGHQPLDPPVGSGPQGQGHRERICRRVTPTGDDGRRLPVQHCEHVLLDRAFAGVAGHPVPDRLAEALCIGGQGGSRRPRSERST